MHANRTWHSSHFEKRVKTRTKSLSRIVPLAASYRFLENSHTKRPSHKHREAEMCKKLHKIHKKLATDQCAQNATPVEETLRKRSNATPVEETPPRCLEDDFCRRNRTCVLRIRALSHKVYLSFQNAKCCRNRIENEHRVCNHCFTCEILQKSHWERT